MLPLVHVPPDVMSVSVTVEPAHTLVGPPIAAGCGLTVTIAVVAHVVGDEYDMVAVPAETPVTTPVEEPTVATPVLPLLHVPNNVASSSVVVELTHTVIVPVMAAGSGLTDTTTERAQPVPNV